MATTARCTDDGPLTGWRILANMSRIHRRSTRHGRRRAERIAGQWAELAMMRDYRCKNREATRGPGDRLSFSRCDLWTDAELRRRATDPNTSRGDLLILSGVCPLDVRRNPLLPLLMLEEPQTWGWLQKRPTSKAVRQLGCRTKQNGSRRVLWYHFWWKQISVPDHVRDAVWAVEDIPW